LPAFRPQIPDYFDLLPLPAATAAKPEWQAPARPALRTDRGQLLQDRQAA
jgi:hypothetical protein